MLKEGLFTSFLENTYTVADFRRRLLILTKYLETVFFVKGAAGVTIEGFLDSYSVQSVDAQFFQSLESGFYKSFHRENYRKLINYFENRMEECPTVRLILPFFPLESQKSRIVNRLENYLGFPIVLDTTYDKSLVAGCEIAWQGRILDFSFSKIVESNHGKIVDYILSKYE